MNAESKPKAKPARRHHYVPQFYLARFADAGQLWCFDCQEGRRMRIGVKDAAVQKDFYISKFRDGTHPMAIEYALAKLEGDLAPAIDRVVTNGSIAPNDLNLIFNFVTLLIVRGPQQRALAVQTAEE